MAGAPEVESGQIGLESIMLPLHHTPKIKLAEGVRIELTPHN